MERRNFDQKIIPGLQTNPIHAVDLRAWLAELEPQFPTHWMPDDTIRGVIAEYLNNTSREDALDRLVEAWGEKERRECRGMETWRLRLRVVLAEKAMLHSSPVIFQGERLSNRVD